MLPHVDHIHSRRAKIKIGSMILNENPLTSLTSAGVLCNPKLSQASDDLSVFHSAQAAAERVVDRSRVVGRSAFFVGCRAAIVMTSCLALAALSKYSVQTASGAG